MVGERSIDQRRGPVRVALERMEMLMPVRVAIKGVRNPFTVNLRFPE